MRQKFKNGQWGLNIFMIILSIIFIAPFVLVVSVSFSNEAEIAKYGYSFLPRSFDLSAYEYVFKSPEIIIQAYKVTFIFSIVTMVLAVVFMSMMAYTLSVPDMKGRGALSFYLYFTMLFGGGLVPTYMLITQYLHLNNTIWVYILPALISPWYVFMMRTNMQGIPKEISESARIDGASEYVIFFKIILPLSKPVLATVALFMFLGHWNDWYTSMLYIDKPSLMSLQYQLQRIMSDLNVLQESENMGVAIRLDQIPTETVKMAMAVVVAGPALVIFPFFQKYFVKGLTVGSVKG